MVRAGAAAVLAGLSTLWLPGCGSLESADVSAPLASETRNGGYGVTIEGKLYALDLAMRGVHLQPYISAGTPHRLETDEEEAVRYHLDAVASPSVLDIVVFKLAELRARTVEQRLFFPVASLIDTMGAYAWVNHSHLPCIDVNDDDNPYPGKRQVAYRYENTIRFCADFQALDQANQAAIVVHEIVYAALAQKSALVDTVGFIFSRAYETFSAPAKAELKRYVEELQKNAIDLKDYGLVTQVGAVAPALVTAWEAGAPDVRFCFGKALVGGDQGAVLERVLLWGVPKEGACASSERRGVTGQSRHLLMEAKANGVLQVGNDVVGSVAPQTLTLAELCTGAASGACVANLGTDAWTLTSGGGVESIHGAARAGNLTRVKWFVAQGTAVDARNEQLETPLLAAVKGGQPQVAAWLVEQGADLEALDKFNQRPMPVAFAAKHRQLVALLAAAGAEVNSQLYLSQVTASGLGACDVEMVEALLQSPTIDVNRGNPLWAAVDYGHYDCVATLIDQAADRLDLEGKPYLAMAAADDNVAMAQLLLNLPAIDPNVDPQYNDKRAVCEAVEHKNLPMLKTLVKAPRIRLDDNACDFMTPFARAFARMGWLEALPVLLDAGASPNAIVNETGYGNLRTLSLAAISGRIDVMDLLIARGADLEAESVAGPAGRRPLAEAVRGKKLESVERLVEAGAKVNPPDAPTTSQPLCIARESGAADIVTFLEGAGAVCKE
jgi:ankyrin repeat protein